MKINRSSKNHLRPRLNGPLAVAMAVAIFGVTGMLIVDHGLWNRPKVQTAEVHNFTTTGDAARAVGAMVTPTEPKSEVEPVAPGPKPAHPVQPPNPAAP